MGLSLPNYWIWDFWFAEDGDDVHVFFLHAPNDVGHQELRHDHARIGHAVSRDLRTWEMLPTALIPGPPGAFDDLATWTGSTLAVDGRWYMFYTGISTREAGAVQRIGLATSDDLLRWEKQGMVLEADPRWYLRRGPDSPDEAWRDPWVCWDDDTRRFHMLIAARANHGPSDARGVIGHAWSADLRSWQTGPPLSERKPQRVNITGYAASRISSGGIVAVEIGALPPEEALNSRVKRDRPNSPDTPLMR